MNAAPLLRITDLTLSAGDIELTHSVNLDVHAGEMVGLIGESGCGKSVTALAVLQLLPSPPIRISGGSIRFAGNDLTTLSDRKMNDVRGREISMIFQEPMTSLNPVFTIGDQIAEPLRIHMGLGRKAALSKAADLLDLVGIPSPKAALSRYPHQLSGGQRQRVMIAMAISCEPKLLIADEPTTALDVTVQKQVLDLIGRLQSDLGLGCLLITHDLGVISEVCDRAYVMYAGRVVESRSLPDLLDQPRHRYTEALLKTIPASHEPGADLPAIPGHVPAPGSRPEGCAFAPRCAFAVDQCGSRPPDLSTTEAGSVACFNPAARRSPP